MISCSIMLACMCKKQGQGQSIQQSFCAHEVTPLVSLARCILIRRCGVKEPCWCPLACMHLIYNGLPHQVCQVQQNKVSLPALILVSLQSSWALTCTHHICFQFMLLCCQTFWKLSRSCRRSSRTWRGRMSASSCWCTSQHAHVACTWERCVFE